MAAPNRPGKTAPRFLHDLLSYDPANPPRSHFNLLKDILPVFHDAESYPELISRRICDHRYVLKPNQSKLIPEDGSLVSEEVYQVSSACLKCRHHVELAVTYKGQNKQEPGHLHHLVYSPWPQVGDKTENPFIWKGQQLETYYFECSYSSCSAIVRANILSPVFNQHFVDLLTDKDLLKQRSNEALAAYPVRLEGLACPSPINVLSNLRAYIENALHDKQRKRAISAVNKRFLACFGVRGRPCQELLEFLEFSPTDDDTSWVPPEPEPTAAIPYQQHLNVFLDNASTELACLISQRPQHEKAGHPDEIAPQSANKFFCQLLGALNYDRNHYLSRNVAPVQRPPYYEDLGAMDDMSNNLILGAYNQQIATHPARAAYYLRCLQAISLWRGDPGGVSIAKAVSYEYANGRYADTDIPEAYSYFQLDYRDKNLSEDAIIGSFFARIGDSADDMEPRRQLWRIGDSRNNEKIKAVAEERVSTVEQALVFLGVDKETADDFVISMYTAKVNDTPASKDLARHAVALIAEARKSRGLYHFLETGGMEATEMDVGEAFQLLQIPDRTVDDAAILAAFSVCCSEAPGQIESYRKAVSVIAKEKQSSLLSNVLAENPAQSARALMEWPVGLNNIGNTCYLNSLLQFYFTILPFRNMVLYFEEHKAELDEDSVRDKRVGSRRVSLPEIERSQNFLKELRSLFQSMITSPSPAVTPGQELARLTLLSSTGEAAIRRKSLVGATRPALGEIDGLPVLGPLGPPTTETDNNVAPVAEDSAKKATGTSDGGSQTTFVSAPTPTSSEQDVRMESMDGQTQNPDKVDTEMKGVNNPLPQSGIPTPPNEPAEISGPPERPPPVPPRPTPQVDKDRLIQEEVELGAQQDVTEVINNVLFQAQCAIKPIRHDADGEPMDLITDLFYGRTKSYISAQRGTRSKEELWADIKVDVATGSRNIYSAIDGAFDPQRVDVEGADAEQHGAISKLPPVLQIQVQRVQFDQVKKTSFKSTHHLELKETIYLDRYMDAPMTDGKDEFHRRRREKWKWKDELRALQARKVELMDTATCESLPDVFKRTRERLEGLRYAEESEMSDTGPIDVDDGVISGLTELESVTRAEISGIENREKELNAFIDAQFADSRTIPYHLYAVFMHHGSVEFGHYYIYIFDFEKSIWRKYNDSYVTEVHDTAEIFGHQDHRNPPTPYFVVYVHDRMRERVAQPVCREVADEPDPALQQSTTEPTVSPAPAPDMAGAPTEKDVEMTEVPKAHESSVSSPGMHKHVAGDETANPVGHPVGAAGTSGDTAWNASMADRNGVVW